MATYTTQAELEEHFGAEQVLIASDRDGDGVADVGVIADAIAEASDEIDSYVAVRYTLPLSTTPGVIKLHCCEITMYRMSAESGALTEEKRLRYVDARDWLKSLAKGTVTIGDAEDSETMDDLPEVSTETNTRLMTRAKMVNLF